MTRALLERVANELALVAEFRGGLSDSGLLSDIHYELAKTDPWAPHLKDGETPFERFMRERADLDALMTLHRRTLDDKP